MITKNKLSILVIFVLLLGGCQSAYYSAMEKVGIHKRDIMVDRVEDAKEAQEEAQQQFKSALTQLTELINFDGGELETQYEATKDQYEVSKKAAEDVSAKIESIKNVADALFTEWSDEISQYSSAKLKRQSLLKLKETERKYEKLISVMSKAEQRMEPVLAALKDNTLYLKHNLNAKAIGSLQGEYLNIKKDVEYLIKDMNVAIKQSQQFIDELKN
jgi:F0F1-type ATP synthase membrane subunit b/b'